MRQVFIDDDGAVQFLTHATPTVYQCARCRVVVEAHHDKYPLCLRCWGSKTV